MNLVMLALHDAKLGLFMTPFFAQTAGSAMRSLADLVNGSGDEPPTKHPEDFKLYLLGSWSPEGYLEVKKSPELVCECVNLKTERR